MMKLEIFNFAAMTLREKKFNLIHRLLHWTITSTILFLLFTVFLRSGWMNKKHIGEIVIQKLGESGYTISQKDAYGVGSAVRNSMWQWHTIFGYVLIGLYVIRMIVVAKQGLAYKNPLGAGLTSKEKFRSWLYLIFYFLLTITLVTGFVIVNGPKSMKEPMVFIHTKALYYVTAFIILHIAGVLIADGGEEKGIISKMVSGDKTPESKSS